MAGRWWRGERDELRGGYVAVTWRLRGGYGALVARREGRAKAIVNGKVCPLRAPASGSAIPPKCTEAWQVERRLRPHRVWQLGAVSSQLPELFVCGTSITSNTLHTRGHPLPPKDLQFRRRHHLVTTSHFIETRLYGAESEEDPFS